MIQNAFAQTTPRKFYKYDVVVSSSSSFNVLSPGPSINDFGDVAFVGQTIPGGRTVYLNEIGQPNVDLLPGLSGTTQSSFDFAVQINNSQQVIAFLTRTGTNPLQSLLYRINGVNVFEEIASTAPIHDFDMIGHNSFAMNGNGEAVFVTQTGTNTPTLTTGERPSFSRLSPTTGSTESPAISDLGEIAARAGGSPTNPLKLYTYDFSSSLTLADSNSGFTAIGQSPGISHLSEVVVFYGDLNQAGADAIGTNPGPGIFASIEVDQKTGERKIVRLAED